MLVKTAGQIRTLDRADISNSRNPTIEPAKGKAARLVQVGDFERVFFLDGQRQPHFPIRSVVTAVVHSDNHATRLIGRTLYTFSPKASELVAAAGTSV